LADHRRGAPIFSSAKRSGCPEAIRHNTGMARRNTWLCAGMIKRDLGVRRYRLRPRLG
jgi:hypothetical protein